MSESIHKDTLHFITSEIESGRLSHKARPHDKYPSAQPADKIRLVAVSDTHSHPDWVKQVPVGDVFIHCGDLTRAGTSAQLLKAFAEIKALPHAHKIVIAGNHDLGLDPHFVARHAQALTQYKTGITPEVTRRMRRLWKSREATSAGIHFLEHEYETVTIRGQPIHFFGSPYTPDFFDWAFMYPLNKDVWSSTPATADNDPLPVMPRTPARLEDDLMIWITHGPAKGVLDAVLGVGPVGCPFLSDSIGELQPDVHFFGHIHEGAEQGLHVRQHKSEHQSRPRGMVTKCVNAAVLEERYRLAYPATVIDL